MPAGVIDRGGLKAAQSGLRMIDKTLPREGKEVLAKAAQKTYVKAAARLASTPHGRYKASLVNMQPYATQRDAGIKVSRTRAKPILHGFEYGRSTHNVPMRGGGSRGYKAAKMRRRVFPPAGAGTRNKVGLRDGYVVAPVIAAHAPKIDQELREEFLKLMNRYVPPGVVHG